MGVTYVIRKVDSQSVVQADPMSTKQGGSHNGFVKGVHELLQVDWKVEL